jgi:hypothetical protein
MVHWANPAGLQNQPQSLMSEGKVSSQHSKIPTHLKTQIFVPYGIYLFYDWHSRLTNDVYLKFS